MRDAIASHTKKLNVRNAGVRQFHARSSGIRDAARHAFVMPCGVWQGNEKCLEVGSSTGACVKGSRLHKVPRIGAKFKERASPRAYAENRRYHDSIEHQSLSLFLQESDNDMDGRCIRCKSKEGQLLEQQDRIRWKAAHRSRTIRSNLHRDMLTTTN